MDTNENLRWGTVSTRSPTRMLSLLSLVSNSLSTATRYEVVYKRVKVGEYIPDVIPFGAIVVGAKVVEAITDHERGQMLKYLKITGLKLGLILNFRRAKLEWERVILEMNRTIRRPDSH